MFGYVPTVHKSLGGLEHMEIGKATKVTWKKAGPLDHGKLRRT